MSEAEEITPVPKWLDKGDYLEPLNGENVRVPRLEVDNATTYIDKDGSNNLTLTDAVTGTKTLAEISAGAGGDVTAAANIDDLAIVVGDGGAKGVKKTGITIDSNDDINIGANKIKTTDIVLKQGTSSTFYIRNAADNNYLSLRLKNLILDAGILSFDGSLAGDIYTDGANNAYVRLKAKDTDGSLVEIARMQGAADPYFQATLPLVFLPIATASLPAAPVEGMMTYDATLNKMVYYNGAAWATTEGAGGGDVAGPGSSTDNAIARFHETSGKVIQDYTSNPPTVSDTGDMNIDGDLDVENIVVSGTVDGVDIATRDHAIYVHPNHSGEVTSVADGGQTITTAAVTLAKMANMATASLIGRNTAATGVPEVLSKATALSLLNVADGADVTGANAPQSHAASHQNSGGDEISVAALSGLLADDQHVIDAEVLAALNTVLPEDTSIKLDATLSADGTYCVTMSLTGTAGEQIDFGESVYFKAGDSKWWLARGNAEITTAPMTGLVISAGAAEAAVEVAIMGEVRADAIFPALVIGGAVFIDPDTAGLVTSLNLTTGEFQKAIGWAKTANVVVLTGNPDWVEVA